MGFKDSGDVIRQQDVIAAEDHQDFLRGNGHTGPVIFGDPGVLFLADVLDAGITDSGHEVPDFVARVGIVHHGEEPVIAVLGQDTVDRFLHVPGIAPVGNENVQRHT
ncbi:hypothetical protein D9M72_519210 [compost metagenome]